MGGGGMGSGGLGGGGMGGCGMGWYYQQNDQLQEGLWRPQHL